MASIFINSALLVASFFFLFFASLTVLSVLRVNPSASDELRAYVYYFMGIFAAAFVAGITLFNSLSEDVIFRFLIFSCCLSLLLLVVAFGFYKSVVNIAALKMKSVGSVIDPLTGIYNRNYIEKRMESEVARCKRYCSPMAVIAIEMADFHSHSDLYGFQSAERMLQKAASIITSSVRESDVVARYNETHFFVILLATPESSIRNITTRLQKNLSVGLNVQKNDGMVAGRFGNVKFGKVWCNLTTATGADLINLALEQIQVEKCSINKQHKLYGLGKVEIVNELEKVA